MNASKIIHKGRERIKLEFINTPGNNQLVRKIKGSTWSKTLNAWHIPYTKEAYIQLKLLFPEFEVAAQRCELVLKSKVKHANLPEVEQRPKIHNDIIITYNKKQILIKIPKNETDIQFIRTFNYVRWDKKEFCWKIPNYRKNLELLKNYFGERITKIEQKAEEVKPIITEKTYKAFEGKLPELVKENIERISIFKKWMISKRYSESTIGTYIDAVKIFLQFTMPKDVMEIDSNDMVRFVNGYIIPKKLSYSYQNQIVNGSKLFFREIVKSRLDVETFERPRREHKLPNVLSKEEVKAILDALTNIKHRTMLSLIYACGLRRSELLNLKIGDVDSKRHMLIIRNAKGRKDRIAPISEKIIEMLRTYYIMYKPKIWLFEGQKAGEQYSEASLQKVLKMALEIAGIKKPATLHWLRHSYATHLLESGTDLRYIQELLGHKSSRTTEIYTHVNTKSLQNIKSPFDNL